jgi:predicted ATPase/serine phosphatase RsbU (regulator of sigma subunit)/tRNA A-37 threonylcarbamoyl transferase component Bud32
MINIPNYQISTQIYESANSLVYRGIRKKDNQLIILKVLKEDYPTPEELTRYRQEYEITHDLDLAGVIKVYGIEKYQNTLVIILEDFGGESLKNILNLPQPLFTKEGSVPPFEKGGLGGILLSDFLPLAIQIADTLGQIHAQNVIHKDINPANIVWNQNTNQVKIIDFGISTRLPRENPTLRNPNQLEGTLAYISPEQTGRMNRALDYRTDLYSLGVTFYELLTGQLPFNSEVLLELVHAHLAKMPATPTQLNPEIPQIISDIIMKLMAKNAEDRYQSAFGVKADLEKCQENLPGLDGENLTGLQELKGLQFKLAQHDFSGRFQIPQKLYGREKEIETLLQAFERVTGPSPLTPLPEGEGDSHVLASIPKGGNEGGQSEMILVAGYSGVGKSALVHEVHKPMTEKQGYFAAGKFDQYQRNIPYLAMTRAFNAFCDYLLTESSEQLKKWREMISNAVGTNGQVLIDVIPHLEMIIGHQPVVAQVGPTEAQNRFNLVFQNFFQAISLKEHPLTLFIDDLQWADLASLNLLKNLMMDTDNAHFMIIGAFRDNEVDKTHPLMLMVDEILEAQVIVNTISVPNLQFQDINQLISDTLGCEIVQTQPLTQLVYDKTHGNAFFTTEFLKSLYQEELLTFDTHQQQWQWEVEKISALAITDNVVELMANKIDLLPTDTIEVLKLAACIGNQFELKTLSVIYQHSLSDTLSILWKAIEESLVLPLDNHYKQIEKLQIDERNSRFKFQHDRIQQAAYFMIADSDKPAFHQQIGGFLLLTHPKDWKDRIFEIVDHLNLGIELVTEQDEKNEIAQFNLQAGKKAKTAMAYEVALNYLDAGRSLLAQDSWETDYNLTLNLYVETLEAKYLNTDFEQARKLAQKVLQQAKTLLDKLKVYEVLIQLYMAKNQMQVALDTAIEGIEMLGISLQKEPPESLKIETYYHLPEMNNPEKLAAMRLLNFAMSPTYTIAPERFPSIVFTMVDLSVKYGNSALAAYGYANYSSILSGFLGNIDSGYQFGQLALHLLNQFDAKEFQVKVLTAIHVVTNHWKKTARKNLPPLLETVKNGIEMGDREYAGIAAMHCASYYFWVGESLEIVTQKQNLLHQILKSVKQKYQLVYLKIWQQTVFNLQGLNTDPGRLIGEVFNEDESLPNLLEANYGMAIFGIYTSKLMLYYLFNDFTQAVIHAELAKDYEQANTGIMVVPIRRFYYSLALLATYSKVSSEKRLEIIRQVDSNQKQMKRWALHAPMNYQHKYDLVEAEKARVLGQLEAIDLYEQAIQGARNHQYFQEEALAYELAAKFYLGRGMEKIAQTYLLEAHYRYQQWGALAKVKHLEERYPQWLVKKMTQSPTSGTFRSTTTMMASSTHRRMTTSSQLDLDSVTKASQTLVGEIVLSRLLSKMMQIVIENAGAERGFLILPRDETWVIEAEGALDSKEVTVLQALPIENHLPEAIVSYVARTHENVVLADARQEELYQDNPYIKKHQTQSVLCFPIVYQRKLRAILYLENNLTTGAFTEERVSILTMLSTQIAISLENAEYANHLEEKVKERTTQLAKANEEITHLAEQLKAENLRMSAELDVAKQLQQMVLPKDAELQQVEGLDIAGFMTPADEVGGDYYDVLQHDGQIKIGIGDVTGHGLESGVLMLMVQTAVRTLLNSGIRDTTQCLNVLNQTIYDNVQRMGTDKNLTLSLLDYQDNQLHVTGQHEQILLVHKNAQIEQIDTFELGFSIGVVDDIADFVSQTEIELHEGEGIVLYTDGITEARDPNKALYGLERLCEVVSINWHLSAHEIQQAVIADVRQYIGTQKVFDDITLLVLKKK